MKKRVLLTSLLTIALCFSLMFGATYALFTSESKVNIAVTSGKVEVEASVEGLKTYSMGVEQAAGVFENGGTAVYNAGVLKLDKMTPGDKVEFDINIVNSSNITIQYRAKWNITGELQNALKTTADGQELSDIDWTVWAAPATAAEKVKTIKVVVELPIETGNEFQNKAAEIEFAVEAVQGNAVNLILVDGTAYDTVEEAIAVAAPNGTIQFAGEIELEGAAGTSQVADLQGITFEGIEEATLVFVNVPGSNSTGTCSFANINLRNVTVVDETFYTGENGENAWEFTYLEFCGTNKFENVEFTDGIFVDGGVSTFENCSFKGHNNDSSSYGNVTMYGAWVYSGEATFIDCTFDGTRGLKVADQYAGSDVEKVLVEGCKFGPLSEKPGIAVDNRNGALELTIKNSEFNSTKAGDAAEGGYGVAYVYEDDNRTPATTVITLENVTVAAGDGESFAITGNDDYKVKVDGKEYAYAGSEAAITEALAAGETSIFLAPGEYVMPAAQGKTVTIRGTKDSKVVCKNVGNSGENCNYAFDGSTVTFEGITINTNSSTYMGYARMNATYNNCTINGTYTLYGTSVFNNCTFNVEGNVYNIWTWGAPEATFNNCTFNSDGKALLLYGQANTKLTINGCTFNDNGGLNELKAAIEIGNDYNTSYQLIVKNTVVNGFAINDKGINTGTTLWANKNSMSQDKLNVVVDGVDVY